MDEGGTTNAPESISPIKETGISRRQDEISRLQVPMNDAGRYLGQSGCKMVKEGRHTFQAVSKMVKLFSPR